MINHFGAETIVRFTVPHQIFHGFTFAQNIHVMFLQDIPDYETLQKLEYLDMFIKESFRVNITGDM